MAEAAAVLILRIIEEEQFGSASIIDLGCGSGITAKILSEQGQDVVGVDFSRSMVALAKKNAPRARFVQASLFDYVLPSCHIVSAIGEPLNYLFDHRSKPERLQELFRNIYKALIPGGYWVFDLLAPGTLGQENPQKKIIEKADWSMFLQVEEDRNQNTLTREITVFYKQGEVYKRSKEIHRQRLYSPDLILDILENTGFRVSLGRKYGDYALRNSHYAYVCRK